MRRALAGLALVAGVAACAGGGDELSEAEFRERAAEICADADRRLQQLAARRPADEPAFWNEVEEITGELEREFESLELSDELDRDLRAWLDAGREVIRVSRLTSAADVIADEEERRRVQQRLVAATRAVDEAEEDLPLPSECSEG